MTQMTQLTSGHRLKPEIKRLLELPASDRITWIDNSDFFIPYATADIVLRRMKRLYIRHNLGKHSGMLILSPPDNGKTTLFRVCEKKHRLAGKKEKKIIPVIRIDAPPTPNGKWLLGEIIAPCDPEAYDYGDYETRMRRARHYVVENKIKLILIDEIHFLLNGTGRQQADCLSTLRRLTNSLPVSIILAGTKSAYALKKHHEELMSRFAIFELPQWSYGLEYLRFLVALESRLPLASSSSLASKEKSIYLLKESGGRIGKVCRIVKEAAIDSLQNGKESISLESLKHSASVQGKDPNIIPI